MLAEKLAASARRPSRALAYPRIPHRDPITGKILSQRKPIILGLRSKMTKTEAREALASEEPNEEGGLDPVGR